MIGVPTIYHLQLATVWNRVVLIQQERFSSIKYVLRSYYLLEDYKKTYGKVLFRVRELDY